MLRRRLLALTGLGCAARAQSPIAIKQTITLVPQLDVFLTDVQPYTLSATPEPGAAVMLFWSGELLLGGRDYTISGNQIAVTQTGCCSQINPDGSSNPVVQVMYWKRG